MTRHKTRTNQHSLTPTTAVDLALPSHRHTVTPVTSVTPTIALDLALPTCVSRSARSRVVLEIFSRPAQAEGKEEGKSGLLVGLRVICSPNDPGSQVGSACNRMCNRM